MARKKSAEAEVCDTAIEALKDAIRDIEVIRQGRGTPDRFWMIKKTFWSVDDALDSINPDTIRRKAQARAEEATKPKPVALIGQQTLFALEDHS